MSFEEFQTERGNVEIVERLDFRLEDVKYLLVDNNNSILYLKTLLERHGLSQQEIALYLSKIVTMQNIREDF